MSEMVASSVSIAAADRSAEEDRLLREPEVREILGLPRNRVYALLADGTIPSLKIGRSVRVRRSALFEWIRETEAKSRENVA